VLFARAPQLVGSCASAARAFASRPSQEEPDDARARETDPEAKLYRNGNSQPAKLHYMSHAMIENRHGVVVQRMPRRRSAELSVRPRWR
jgi:hypothetical protein